MPEQELYEPPLLAKDYVILLVPGWNYTNNEHVTGSDFAAPRRLLDRFGIENHLLLVPPNGSVMQSASVIADQGPNDGLTPLVDIIACNSLTLVATGSDHYFGEDPQINLTTIAMVKTILDLVQRSDPDHSH